jgi:hypothetical protein
MKKISRLLSLILICCLALGQPLGARPVYADDAAGSQNAAGSVPGENQDPTTVNGNGAAVDPTTGNDNGAVSDPTTGNGNDAGADITTGNDNGASDPATGSENPGKTNGPASTEIPERPASIRYAEYEVEGRGASAEAKKVYYSWYSRSEMPIYSMGLYSVLQNATANGTSLSGSPSAAEDLADPYSFRLPLMDDVLYGDYEVEELIQEAEVKPLLWLSDGYRMAEASFKEPEFYTVSASAGDHSIDYGALKPGDVVRTTAYNGIFVTSLKKSGNPDYDAQAEEIKKNIFAVFEAFELDHPEVFWLTGASKVRVATVTKGGSSTSFFFLVLADTKGFSMLQSDYASSGALTAAINRRDAAANTILNAVSLDWDARQKVRTLNAQLTQKNEYNRSSDLSSIGYKPHRALSALVGDTGFSGPVCDGYSRAFKLLCDRLGIPCILVGGYASSKPEAAPQYHMWNQIQLEDGKWYGVDITWDDPVVSGSPAPVSGYENENYLFARRNTVINGLEFGQSHQSFGGMMEPVPPFNDVYLDDYFGGAVAWAFNHTPQITDGVSKNRFAPANTVTRGQAVTFLWRAMGCPVPTISENPFEDVPESAYYYKPVLWAYENGITDGTSKGKYTPDSPVKRGQMITFLWRTMGEPEKTGLGAWYEDAEKWANGKDLLSGTEAEYKTTDECPRADVVYYLWKVLDLGL